MWVDRGVERRRKTGCTGDVQLKKKKITAVTACTTCSDVGEFICSCSTVLGVHESKERQPINYHASNKTSSKFSPGKKAECSKNPPGRVILIVT